MTGRPADLAASTVAAVFREHHGELVRLAVLMVGDLATAEDVVQDVYASLHRLWRSRAADDAPLPYIRAAVLNGCRSTLRRRGIARRAGALQHAQQRGETRASAESEVILSEDRRAVLAALTGLPRRRREVLVLRYYLGLSEAEIAAVLGISPRKSAWLIPAAAAASVVLVIALAVALTGGLGHKAAPGASRGGAEITAKDVPRYFAAFNWPDKNSGKWRVVVLAIATGAQVAATPLVSPPAGPVSIAAAPDDRTFYVAYVTAFQTRIYTFSIPAHGKTAPMTLIKGGVLNNSTDNQFPYLEYKEQLVVSPDGTKLALTTGTAVPATQMAEQIVIINLRTGAHRLWQGGLDRPGKALGIVNLSWADDGRSLVFLAQWCDPHGPPIGSYPNGYCSGAKTTYGYRDAQVRSLDATTGGGSLSDSRVLLRQSAEYPTIVQAIAGPGGQGLTAVVLTGPITLADDSALWKKLEIDQISADGALAGTEYRAAHSTAEFLPAAIMLNWDPSGKYLIFTDSYQPLFAWVGGGMLHRLPFNVGTGLRWVTGPVTW